MRPLSPRWAEAHTRFCAAKNWRTALGLLLFSAVEAFICWTELAKPLADHRSSVVVLLGYGCAVFILIQIALPLRCYRERVVLALAIVSFLKAILVGLGPGLVAPGAHFARELSFLLWAAASLTSLSLLYSALRVIPTRHAN
jgi:hypothetical protein